MVACTAFRLGKRTFTGRLADDSSSGGASSSLEPLEDEELSDSESVETSEELSARELESSPLFPALSSLS